MTSSTHPFDYHSWLEILSSEFHEKTWIKLSISSPRHHTEFDKLIVKLVEIKKQLQLNFVYRYRTKDITKNYPWDEAKTILLKTMTEDFTSAHFVGTHREVQIQPTPKGPKMIIKKTLKESPSLNHNHKKQYWIQAPNLYLQQLGICTSTGQIKHSMQDKFKQINHFVDIMDGLFKKFPMEKARVIDMGSGKGYLTFALADYFQQRQVNCQITGVELRSHLVDFCNQIAKECGFSKLDFVATKIEDLVNPQMNVLIALHACDTATDDAIFQGLQSGAQMILCAPCCHKQIRTQMEPESILRQITQFGILKERHAESLTDTIRAHILEAFGYHVKVMEFIPSEHTPKNVLIAATLDSKLTKPLSIPKPDILQKITELKAIYGVKQHYLETLLTNFKTKEYL